MNSTSEQLLMDKQHSIAVALETIERMRSHEGCCFRQAIQHVYAFDTPNAIDLAPETSLTKKGNPVEFAFVWPSDSLRLTLDPLPGGAPINRLRRAGQLAGFQPAPFSGMEQAKYGAWLGIRAGKEAPSYKIYQEVPPKMDWVYWHEATFGKGKALEQLGAQLVMVGYPEDGTTTECYYRLNPFTIHRLQEVQRRIGFSDRSKEILPILETLCGQYFNYKIPTSNAGFSVTYDVQSRPVALTVYSVASALLGMDHQIRKYILKLGKVKAYDTRIYEAITDSLQATVYDLNTWHGMVGVVAPVKGEVQFTVGISPKHL